MDNQGFPRIATVFDCDSDHLHSVLYSSWIRNTLMRLLPSHLFFSDDPLSGFIEGFFKHLPTFKWVEWGEGGSQLSIYLLCRHRVNGVKFFYEMISRWLMPGKRPRISSFFSADFHFPELLNEIFTLCEIVISLDTPADQLLVRAQLPIIESEIRLGLISVYHASRILEIKGLSADEKTSRIQERISSLLLRRPKDFDHAIFAQMQHFLVLCSDEFKAVREYGHMSRIIYVFYLLRRALKNQIELHPGQRFIFVKASKTQLHLTFGVKKVLGIFAALNFQGDNELFEERHFVRVFAHQFPELSVVEDSCFFRTSKEDRTQTLYLEVEKRDGSDFTLSEVRSIKQQLPDEIRNGIEKLTHPLFMPRNEEEVMRNIITLASQLKLSRDIPQVIIKFDEQTEAELSFTVIWLRVLVGSDLTIQELFEHGDSFLKYVPDRIKQVGLLRKKHPKEATVFQVRFSSDRFLRPDHSVDLFKARQSIVEELLRLLGEFRDYNGGMISKQHEQYLELKALLPPFDSSEEILLENFFHSIFPIELRSVFNPLCLKILFTMVLEAVQKGKEGDFDVLISEKFDLGCAFFLFSFKDASLKEGVLEGVRSFQVPSSQLLTLSMRHLETSYAGVIYLAPDREMGENFLRTLSQRLTFEPQTGYQ